jgi:hypothetical protein
MKLEITKYNDGEFEGRIKGTEFSLEQLFALGYEGLAPEYVNVEGEYYIGEDDGEEFLDQIIGASAFGKENGKMRTTYKMELQPEEQWGAFPVYKNVAHLVPAHYWIDLDVMQIEVV